MQSTNSPQKPYIPCIREPLPLPTEPHVLPPPPAMPQKPSQLEWFQTLLLPLIILVVLYLITSFIKTSELAFYLMAVLGAYPLFRLLIYIIQAVIYNHKRAERKSEYEKILAEEEKEILKQIAYQRSILLDEYLDTNQVCQLALDNWKKTNRLWCRTADYKDFLSLRLGFADGNLSFAVETPKQKLYEKDLLLGNATKIVNKYHQAPDMPYLLELRKLGSIAILGPNSISYGLARRLILDAIVHHPPNELHIFVLSTKNTAIENWSWLRWSPHCQVFSKEYSRYNHLAFGINSIKNILRRLDDNLDNNFMTPHYLIVIDVDGIQKYADDFIKELLQKSTWWNISLLFVGCKNLPRPINGLLKIKDDEKCLFVDTRIPGIYLDYDNRNVRKSIMLDQIPDIAMCEKVARSLSSIKLLDGKSNMSLPIAVSLFDVLGKRLVHFDQIVKNWLNTQNGNNGRQFNRFSDSSLLQFPIGLIYDGANLKPYSLNLLEASLGGKDAYHTILIGTTGSGKSEFIKSLILGAVYKYPPQYLNFFFMDFKGGATVDRFEDLPHVIGVMTNLNETMAQRGMIAVSNEIDRRQARFNQENVKDIWEYNQNKNIKERMPHLVLILDEFTRGFDMLDDPTYGLHHLLEKKLVPQGRSLGIYLLLANQVANAKAMKLIPNIGWKIALHVTNDKSMRFISKGLKSPKYVGRGYIKPLGEEPLEFQSGYSGTYAKNLKFMSSDISIIEILPNGKRKEVKANISDQFSLKERANYTEISLVINATKIATNKLEIPPVRDIYNKPLSRTFDLKDIYRSGSFHRKFFDAQWTIPETGDNALKVPVGYVDLVKKCKQKPLVLDFKGKNPYLWIAGNQSDVIDGLRSVLFSLTFSHTPEDIQIYMLEFGSDLRTLPEYPHVGDIVPRIGKDKKSEIERIDRTIQHFENEIKRREEVAVKNENDNSWLMNEPRLFLFINNIAGVKAKSESWYQRILQFIQKESHKYGVHVILTSLPRSTGARVSSGDLKMIASRIIFPTVSHDNYWIYLDMSDRKLIKLTKMDGDDENLISRAYWYCTTDPEYNFPYELQLSKPEFDGKSDKMIAQDMKESQVLASVPEIEILKEKYPLKDVYLEQLGGKIAIGIRQSDLRTWGINFQDLPNIWGVSGPKGSGKSIFLITFISQLIEMKPSEMDIEVMSIYPSILTEYCNHNGINVKTSSEEILPRMKEIAEEVDQEKKRLIVIEDIHLFWEREDEELIEGLDQIAFHYFTNSETMFIASFSYPGAIQSQKIRNAFVKTIHDNKTGMCLGFQDKWAVSPETMMFYQNMGSTQPPPGRGFFVQESNEQLVQTFILSNI